MNFPNATINNNKKRRKSQPGRIHSAADQVASEKPTIEAVEIPVAKIDPSPFQPRRKFDADKIKALAASLKTHGQRTPISVRKIGNKSNDHSSTRFELVGGERRFRAAKIAKIKTLRAEVETLSDDDARRLALVDNLEREDLTDVERFRSFRDLLAAGIYKTQKDLAAAVGITTGALSNQLRILELPECVFDAIESGKIFTTHARLLVKYKDHPAIVAKMVSRLIDEYSETDGPHPMSECKWTFERVIDDMTRPAKQGLSFWRANRHTTVHLKAADFKKNPELNVVDFGSGPVCLNVKLFEELNGSASAKKKTPAAADPKTGETKTPAQLATLQRERKRKLANGLFRYKIAVLHTAIAEAFDGCLADFKAADAQRITTSHVLAVMASGYSSAIVGAAIKTGGGKYKIGQYNRLDPFRAAATVDDKKLTATLYRSIAGFWLLDPMGYKSPFQACHVLDAAPDLNITIENQFAPDRGFFDLFTGDQLIALVKEWKATAAVDGDASFRKKTTVGKRDQLGQLVADRLQDADADPFPCPALLSKVSKLDQSR